jgi:hypothetical protein
MAVQTYCRTSGLAGRSLDGDAERHEHRGVLRGGPPAGKIVVRSGRVYCSVDSYWCPAAEAAPRPRDLPSLTCARRRGPCRSRRAPRRRGGAGEDRRQAGRWPQQRPNRALRAHRPPRRPRPNPDGRRLRRALGLTDLRTPGASPCIILIIHQGGRLPGRRRSRWCDRSGTWRTNAAGKSSRSPTSRASDAAPRLAMWARAVIRHGGSSVP